MAIDPEEKQRLNDEGQKAGAEDLDQHLRSPWPKFFESDEDFYERHDAWQTGYDNAQEQKKTGCFLSTACVEHAGLSDDCHELTVLRHFRDNYVQALSNGPALISEYYTNAPRILATIAISPESDSLLASTFATIQQAVERIESDQPAMAFAIYSNLFEHLKHNFPST